MSREKERVEVYQHTIERLEPDIAMVDLEAAAASAAISFKRTADALERIANSFETIIELLNKDLTMGR